MSLNRLLTTLVVAAVLPSVSLAASDPNDPDCPIIQQMQSLARQVDVFNGVCRSPFEQCAVLHSEIEQSAEFAPGILSEAGNGIITFDPSVVFSTIDYQSAFPQVFACDPEDEDCDGKTSDLRRIHQNIQETGEGIGVWMSFPTSNFYAVKPQ